MESRDILIRKTTFDDCKFFVDWENKPSVTQFISMDTDRSYEEIVREYITRESDESKLQFTICLNNGEYKFIPIGRIYLSRIDIGSDSLDITKIYIADENNRGKGYGEEAVRMILDYCFIQLHTERVTLDHFTVNSRAAGLYTKLGFKPEGIARNACKKDGKYFDLHIMSILRAEYYGKLHEKK